VAVTIEQVRESMADAITAGTGLASSAWLEDQINPPCVQIGRRAMDPRMVFGGTKNGYVFLVKLFVSRISLVDGQRAIDKHCATSGADSIKAAVENGALWGVSVDYAAVTNIGETVEVEVAGVAYLSVDFDVEVVW